MRKRLIAVLLCMSVVLGNSTVYAKEDERQDMGAAASQDTESQDSGETADISAGIADTSADGTKEEELKLIEERYINPVYEAYIDESVLEQQLQSVTADRWSSYANTQYTTVDEAARYIKSQMLNRNNVITFTYVTTGELDFWELVDAAMEYTDSCSGQEGDSLRYVWSGYDAKASGYRVGSTKYYDVTYSMGYYTTYDQEQQLTGAVNAALDSLNLGSLSEADKIKAIHDYICTNVDYDYDNLYDDSHLLKYTAYAALLDGKAVCQGYAVLFYRMCKEAGLSVRVIPGSGQGELHAWNIVRIGQHYYNIDPTWNDQDTIIRDFYLKSDRDFYGHIREKEYTTGDFYSRFPMSAVSYTDGTDGGGNSAEKDGLVWENGNYYYYENGSMVTSKEVFAEGAWRWFDADGTMAVSKDVYQASSGGKWVRYNPTGEMIKGYDVTDDGVYYFDPATGAMSKGVTKIDGKYYYFLKDTGVRVEDKNHETFRDGAWMWFDADGTVAVSKDVYQPSSGGKWVRYDSEARMVKGWDTNENGTYYFDPTTGAMSKGVTSVDGKYYYFLKDSGIRVEDKDHETFRDGAWMWFDADGTVAVSKDVYQPSSGGKWVRYDAEAKMTKGWDTNKNGTYYFDPTTGAMQKGWVTIDEKRYHFDESTGILK